MVSWSVLAAVGVGVGDGQVAVGAAVGVWVGVGVGFAVGADVGVGVSVGGWTGLVWQRFVLDVGHEAVLFVSVVGDLQTDRQTDISYLLVL